MAYTAVKVVTEVQASDNKKYNIYEPKAEVDMLDKAVTIKKLVGSYRLEDLQHDKEQYEARIAHLETQIVVVNGQIAAIKNLVTPVMEK